jgi:putative DNA-binding protein
MPSLHEVQRGFVAATVFGDTGALAGLGIVAGALDPAARIAIYRNNVLGNCRKALAATYPIVQRLVGAPFFNAAIDAFVRAYPSPRGDVNRYGRELARFLAAYPPARELPYLPDVARLEWAIDQANIAAGASPFDTAALRAVPAGVQGALRFVLHPSAQFVASPYPIFHIWQVNQPDQTGDDRVDLGEGGDALLVRRASDGIVIERLAAGVHAFLAALAGNRSLNEATERASGIDPSFDMAGTLKRHVAAGSIVAFRVPSNTSSGVPR